MARPSRSYEIEDALLQAVVSHPRDLVGMVAAQLGLSSARISTQVRALVESGYLVKSGSTRPTYTLGRNRSFSRSFPRVGLAEDTVWYEHLQPLLRDLPRSVLDIVHYGVTEMVNNAIDHSDAEQLYVYMNLRDSHLQQSWPRKF